MIQEWSLNWEYLMHKWERCQQSQCWQWSIVLYAMGARFCVVLILWVTWSLLNYRNNACNAHAFFSWHIGWICKCVLWLSTAFTESKSLHHSQRHYCYFSFYPIATGSFQPTLNLFNCIVNSRLLHSPKPKTTHSQQFELQQMIYNNLN